MYSYEILNLLREKQYLISVEEYLQILSTSPQITRIHYDGFNDNFEIETEDRLNVKFKVRKRGNKNENE